MRYKKYRYGGKKVPGMYAEDGMEVNPAQPMQPMNQGPNLSPQQMQAMQMQELLNKHQVPPLHLKEKGDQIKKYIQLMDLQEIQ